MLKPTATVQYLKGVGEKRAQAYTRLGVETIDDLLRHFPRDYIDLQNPYLVMEAPLGETCAIKARLLYKSGEQRIRKGLSIFKLRAEDETGELEITIFNAVYLVRSLEVDQEYIFYGKLDGNLLRREMSAPQIYPADETAPILPIYAQTAGIQTTLIRRNIQQILDEMQPLIDPILEPYRLQYNIGEINSCFRQIHFPTSMAAAKFARERFIFEEFLTLSCAFAQLRAEKAQHPIPPMKAQDLSAFYQSLPFVLTGAQQRCIKEALKDMQSGAPMNRLIQGDVGSGKTVVAAACIYFAYQNKAQSALMVPTEILAEQHFQTLSDLLSPLGMRCALLTGSTKAAERREILAALKDGTLDLCIGTHALLTDTVEFENLELVITDEQHRFGVSQRAKLSQKSEDSHVLVMSATPIPRTLSLIIYGDLSVSIIDELPPGRKPVDTLVIDSGKRARALGFVRDHVDAGRQAYIVCPLIEAGEIDQGLQPAVDYAEQISENELKGYNVGLLHGRMKAAEKEKVMRDFKNGDIQVLVSTTVVEVGVDVPNATIMFIENAERFGLSQLHQLRGRVGRGEHKSWCILVSDSKGELARQRLQAMRSIEDGFKLAEYDLSLRGPGDFFGFRQHGLPTLKVANFSENMSTLLEAQECAEDILKKDPLLELAEHAALKNQVDAMLHAVGDRPN